MKWFPAAGTTTPQAPANVQLYRLGRVPEPASPPRVSPIQVEAQTRQALPADRVAPAVFCSSPAVRSEEHTSELQSLMRISYAVFCLKTKTLKYNTRNSEINRKI